MIKNIINFIDNKTQKGELVALVTLISKGGSTPGTTGQIMVVDKSGNTVGTVGGGKAEYIIIQKAIDAINNKEKFFEFDFSLDSQGMICGGSVRGYGTILGFSNSLVIFGAGHISQKLYCISKEMDFLIKVVDEREEFKPYFKDATYLKDFSDLHINNNTYVVICTKDHESDYEALKFCVSNDFAYIGMIGSKKKIKILLDDLKKDGISENIINKINAPIGLNIDDGTPSEIAVAIMAEIIKIKNNGKLEHLKK